MTSRFVRGVVTTLRGVVVAITTTTGSLRGSSWGASWGPVSITTRSCRTKSYLQAKDDYAELWQLDLYVDGPERNATPALEHKQVSTKLMYLTHGLSAIDQQHKTKRKGDGNLQSVADRREVQSRAQR